MRGDQNNHGQNQNHYAKQGKMTNQYNQHVNVPNKYNNEAHKKNHGIESPIKIINHHNQHINEACIKNSQCAINR